MRVTPADEEKGARAGTALNGQQMQRTQSDVQPPSGDLSASSCRSALVSATSSSQARSMVATAGKTPLVPRARARASNRANFTTAHAYLPTPQVSN